MCSLGISVSCSCYIYTAYIDLYGYVNVCPYYLCVYMRYKYGICSAFVCAPETIFILLKKHEIILWGDAYKET